MAAGRSLKSLLARRRRADEEGEDEEGPVIVEDSQSEGSILSDADDDDADASTLGGGEPSVVEGASVLESNELKPEPQVDGNASVGKKSEIKRKGVNALLSDAEDSSRTEVPSKSFKALADTEAMMNGLKIDGPSQGQEAVDFEEMSAKDGPPAESYSTSPRPAPFKEMPDPAASRPRREHDEPRRKRDADPAFISQRGTFFMHDTRTNNSRGVPATRGAWNSRGRGRGAGGNVGGPFSPANQMASAERAAEQPWKHDLHDTINEEPSGTLPSRHHAIHDQDESARLFPKAGANGPNQPHSALNFSSTVLKGKLKIRVSLPGMPISKVFSDVPWREHTRLPDHRPPLRRDKPVRVFLAGHDQRFIFPTAERSFIFIPRQMRPNQQSFGRSGYARSIGGYGYSSRRTSMYGGSVYATSNAQSRRSSFASVARENAFSPVGFYGQSMPPNRPNVRLPHGSQAHFSIPNTPMGPFSGHQTPTGVQMHTYDLPQAPERMGIPTTTMHQPRPQKAISVPGIESPAAALQQQSSVPAESQLFQNQLPVHMTEQSSLHHQPPQYFSSHQNYQFAHQPQGATPLSGIPEQAVHASAFHPSGLGYGQNGGYYSQYQPQQSYYYPPMPNTFQPMQMFVPPAQGYMVSPPAPAVAPQQQPLAQATQPETEQPSQPQSGMMAHEKNGTTFYMTASEAQKQPEGKSYQPAESFVPTYAMPGLPPPTPPEAQYYYAPTQMPGMQELGSAMYYPAQSQPLDK